MGGRLILKNNNSKYNTIPSKKASYNIDGCLGTESTSGKITPQLELVAEPYNSELIKFQILPKNKPIGINGTRKSDNLKNFILFLMLKNIRPTKTPIKAP